MNLAELQSETAKLCGNLATSHPLYSLYIAPSAGSEDQSLINRAANKFIMYAVGLNGVGADAFPELRNTWTAGPTVASQNYQPRPADCLAVTSVACAHATVAGVTTPPVWATSREYPMNFMDTVRFGNLVKDSTATNFPSIWTPKGKNILYWPTTDADHVDYLRYYGLKIENVLVSGSDEFFMFAVWHDFVALLAAQMLALRLGWYDQAAALWEQFQRDLTGTLNVTAMEEQGVVLGGDHAPTRFSVYGR
jgi:hypothetical protein